MPAPLRGPEGTERGVRPRAVAIVAVLAIVAALLPLPALAPRAHATLVVLVAAAGLWISEAVPVAWTALAIPILAVVLGIAEPKAAFAGFGDPILFLFFGTFLLTTAAFDHGLQARLTHAVLHSERVRRHPGRLLWAVAFLGCGLSAWVNNTATTALLLPLALTAEGRVPRRLLLAVLLMASYAPSLGGISTPVGTAPNLIGLRLLASGTGHQVSFAHWCAVFAPLAVLCTALAALALQARRPSHGAADQNVVPAQAAARAVEMAVGAPEAAPDQAGSEPTPQPRRPWTLAERTLLPLYASVVLFWILPGILQATSLREATWVEQWSARLPETVVPLVGGLLLFLLPSGALDARGRRQRILDARVLPRIDWSTLLLFGGGLSLGGLMFETGLARALGEAIFAVVPVRGTVGIVFAATLMGVLVSEVTTNTASASLVVPVVLALAQAAGVDPVKPALAATVGCSFGFMLPVSTPPNALVYSTGRVRVAEMVRYGVWLDLLGIVLVTAWVTLFG